MTSAPILLVILGWAIAAGSPGPATLAISGTSMAQGRRAGLTIAAGIVVGSATWGILAAAGVSAAMRANAWVFELIRYAGAGYLLFLALKSLKTAVCPDQTGRIGRSRSGRLFLKGTLLHLTNPKAVLAWGSIYSIALPLDANTSAVWTLFGYLSVTSAIVFLGYAVMFSTRRIAHGYAAARRWFDLAFAALFGAASLKILTAEIDI